MCVRVRMCARACVCVCVQSAFENGSRDTFSLTTPQLGAIQTLTLAHDGKGMGAAWQVDTAELENVATGGCHTHRHTHTHI